MFRNFRTIIIFNLVFQVLAPILLFAQQNIIRPYTAVYSINMNGGSTIIGNTILQAMNASNSVDLIKMNAPTNTDNGSGNYGNDGENMQFVDIDQITATKNSSSANLVLPSGINTIKFARLYWGGRFDTTGIKSVVDTLRKVKLRFGNGAYTNLSAPLSQVDQSPILLNGENTTQKNYQSYIDITDFVVTNKTGTYTVADIPVTTGVITNGGYFGGWALVVAYENLTQPFNSIRIFDGFSKVAAGANTSSLSINLSGLDVPSTPLSSGDAIMGVMVWEGDASLGVTPNNPSGDFIKINNVSVSNGLNSVANFWNGSITRNNVKVTNKNPDYNNQMGIDIDEVNVGTGYNILPNATSVSVQFGTEADTYFPTLFTFNIRSKKESLPVNNLSFSAILLNGKTQLKWSTESELNNKFFIIERSVNGNIWEGINEIPGAGNSNTINNYFHIDENTPSGTVYYRIKQVDIDGSFSYSSIEIVRNNKNRAINILPNPSTGFYLIQGLYKSKDNFIKVYDGNGKVILSKSTKSDDFKMDLTSFPDGIYYLNVNSDNEYSIQKIIKRNK